VAGARCAGPPTHEKPGHFLDLLLDRLLDDPNGISGENERSGMAVAFAEAMDEAVLRTGQVRANGHSEIWDKTRFILRKEPPPDFLSVVRKGKSINWLALIVRDQGFALGLPKGHRSNPENAWLKRDEFDECVAGMIDRFKSFGMRKIFALPAPMDVLFCWSQLGDAEEVKERFAEATKTETKFLKGLEAIRGWVNSSDRGVYHPLYAQYVLYVADPEQVRSRLEQLALRSGSDAHSAKAKELLVAWEPLPYVAKSEEDVIDEEVKA
jgi:hypothetical protein